MELIMEVKMKKCKECGQMFVPKNPRSQYCDAKHYRPCPVCGELVEIKYLSDPTPRCASCRKLGLKVNATANTKLVNVANAATKVEPVNNSASATENVEDLPSDFVQRKYTGHTNCGFISSHIYLVKVRENKPYGFIVEAIKDITDNEDVDDTEMGISSPKSFKYFFKEVTV